MASSTRGKTPTAAPSIEVNMPADDVQPERRTREIVLNITLTTNTAMLNAIAPREQPSFPFLSLPAELRIYIYTYALTVGKVFYTPTSFELREGRRFKAYKRYPVPNLALLRVCREIHTEAEFVYLSTNMFVLPPQYAYHSPFRQHVGKVMGADCGGSTLWLKDVKDRPLFSRRGLELVKNVSLNLCNRGDVRTHLGATRSMWEAQELFGTVAPLARMQAAHKEANDRLSAQWSIHINSLKLFSTGLDYVELDITNSFCGIGCCRMIYVKMDLLETLEPKDVRVLGCFGKSEEEWLMKEWARKSGITENGLKGIFGVRFGGKDRWARWVSEVKKVEVVYISE